MVHFLYCGFLLVIYAFVFATLFEFLTTSAWTFFVWPDFSAFTDRFIFLRRSISLLLQLFLSLFKIVCSYKIADFWFCAPVFLKPWHGLLNNEKLDKDLEELTGLYQQCRAVMKETESELKSVNRQLRLLGQYYNTKKTYREYVKGGKQKAYLSDRQSEIELYEAAIKELRDICGGDKLPSVQILKERKAELTALKQKQYDAYMELRVQWMELSKLAKNCDSMLGQDKQTELGNKKTVI